jgi:multiple sugar transport system substrate-binding protein
VAEDITDLAAGNGFDVGSTFPAIVPELTVEGRQYAFPRNVGTVMVWVNREAFRRVGMEPPPRRWTVDEFERIGREFVKRANPPGGPRTTFLMPQMGGDRIVLIRSLGGDHYNETLTASAFDSPAAIEVYDRLYQWTHVDRILPTKAEAKSLSADSGVVPITYHLFAEGKYGTMRAGRWGLMFFREVGIGDLGLCAMPNLEFRNTRIGIGAAILYAGSKKKELASYFFKFLASPEFNNLLIEGADALPPVPAYASGDAFSRPPGRENEWGLHDPFLETALNDAIPIGVSPFVLASTVSRVETDAYERFMAGRLTAEEAVRKASEAIDREIARTVAGTKSKEALYDSRVEDQKKIDALRAAGKPVPAELIRNPFHLKYYAWKGWLADE